MCRKNEKYQIGIESGSVVYYGIEIDINILCIVGELSSGKNKLRDGYRMVVSEF